MENEGAIGPTHRSSYRVAAAPTPAKRSYYDSQDHFGILDYFLFLKAIRQGRREDVKWHGVHLLWE